MPVTLKLVLRESKAREDGTAPIWLRITANRKSRFISTGVYIKPKHWNEGKQQVRKSHPLSTKLNVSLREKRLEAEKVALDVDSAQAVKDELHGQGGSLTSFVERHIETLDNQGKYWPHKKYKVTLRKIRAALGEDVNWKDFDEKALTKFERYCREERGNNPNTTRKELSRLRRIARKAVKEGVLDPGDNPFVTYEMPKGVPADRRRLSLREINAIQDLDLPGDSDLKVARDSFLLAFYGGGIRFGDVCCLEPSNISEGRLRYRMMKTDKVVAAPLPDPALEIVNFWSELHDGPFLFPLLEKGEDKDPSYVRQRISSCNVIVNRNLKTIAEQAEIANHDEVSFHVARHSFADFARRQSGDLYAVSKALGHSDLKVTERYLSSFDQDAVDRLANDLWTDE